MPSLRLPIPLLAPALVLAATLWPAIAAADPVTATVLDAVTSEPVPGATITLRSQALVTDAAGRALVGDLPGPVAVTVSAPGYEPIADTLSPDSQLLLLFRPGAGETIEIHDRAPPPSPAASTLIAADVIRGLPGGGGDALAAVRSMPGVGQAPPTAGGRLVIRGGAPEDTRLTIDGIAVPFLYHAFNNTTILPVSGIAGIEYTPGGFGVEEGRATGGTVALTTDDAQPARPTGSASISLLEVAAQAAAPISVSRRLAISGGLRRSTVDFLAPIAVPDNVQVGFTTAPRFYDGQLRLDWRPTDRDRIAVLGMLSSDALGVVNNDPDSELPSAFSTETRFARLIASWKHRGRRFDNRLVGALGSDAWHAEIGLDQNVDGTNRSFVVRDDLRVAAGERLQLRAGAVAELASIDIHALAILPPTEGLPPGRIDQIPIRKIDSLHDANYAAAYAAADLSPAKSTTISPGVRIETFGHLEATRVSPRVQVRHRTGPFTLTAALGRYARDLDQAEGVPADLRPERATQGTLGGELAIAEGVTYSLTGFYTDRRDLVVEDPSRTGMDELPFSSGGSGRSTGFETLLRAQRGPLFAWLAYTYSRSTRRDAPDAAGRPFAFDQTHLVSAVGSYQRGPWRVGARWQLASGLPYTEVTGAVWVPELSHHVPIFGAPHAARMATSHSLDLRVERTWQRRGYRIAAFADLGNVYRHERVLRYQYSDDFMSRKPVADMLPLPSIGIRGEL
jgi:hypothetical protein